MPMVFGTNSTRPVLRQLLFFVFQRVDDASLNLAMLGDRPTKGVPGLMKTQSLHRGSASRQFLWAVPACRRR